MKDVKVRLFIKPYCPWCAAAMQWLDRHKISYEVIDVIRDPKAYEEMIRLSGQTRAPVLEVNGKVLADFGPEELSEWWPQVEAELRRSGS